jgi:hypothetical protein
MFSKHMSRHHEAMSSRSHCGSGAGAEAGSCPPAPVCPLHLLCGSPQTARLLPPAVLLESVTLPNSSKTYGCWNVLLAEYAIGRLRTHCGDCELPIQVRGSSQCSHGLALPVATSDRCDGADECFDIGGVRCTLIEGLSREHSNPSTWFLSSGTAPRVCVRSI